MLWVIHFVLPSLYLHNFSVRWIRLREDDDDSPMITYLMNCMAVLGFESRAVSKLRTFSSWVYYFPISTAVVNIPKWKHNVYMSVSLMSL